MEKQYSVQFFNSLVEQLQDLCRNHLHFSQFVEVSGYLSVEIDNTKKERYVLSEILQSNGNVVSESFCAKAFETSEFSNFVPHGDSRQNSQKRQQELVMRRSVETRDQRQQARHRSQYRRDARAAHSRPLPASSYGQDADKTDQRWQGFGDMISFTDIPISSSRNEPRVNSSSAIKCENSKVSSFANSPLPTLSNIQCDADEYQSEPVQPTCKTVSSTEISASLPHSVSTPDVKPEPSESSYLLEEIEVIDLDLFEDEPQTLSFSTDEPSQCGASASNEFHPVPSQSQPAAPKYTQRASLKSGSRGVEHVIKYAVSQFRKYHIDQLGDDIDMSSLPPERLNDLLLDFYEGVRKNDGGLPTATTLKNLQAHLHRYLKDKGYPHSIMKDATFQSCRQFIRMKMDDMAKCGQSQKYVPVTEDDIEVMFQAKQLGSHNLESLLNTMWVLNSKYLCIKRPSEHFNLKWGDIVLCQDKEGNEYLQRRLDNYAMFPVKVYAQSENPGRCLVSFYKEYYARRPEFTTGDEYPFYLRYTRGEQSHNPLFQNEALSMHQLGVLWRKMANESGLPMNKKMF